MDSIHGLVSVIDGNLSAMPFRLRSTARRRKDFRPYYTGAALVPTALRLPPPMIRRRVAACLSVSKLCMGSRPLAAYSGQKKQSLMDSIHGNELHAVEHDVLDGWLAAFVLVESSRRGPEDLRILRIWHV